MVSIILEIEQAIGKVGCSRRMGFTNIAKRIDHFLLGGEWSKIDWLFQEKIVPLTRLDHFPICLNIWNDATPERDPFRFERMWLRKEVFLGRRSLF